MSKPLAAAWTSWIVGNLLRQRPIEDLIASLVEEGLPEERARHEVETLANSPALAAVDEAIGPLRRAALLRRSILRAAGRDVVSISADPSLYLNGFATAQTPVLLKGATAHWAAMRWTWASLRSTWGTLEVEALTNRDEHTDPGSWEKHVTAMSFAHLIDRVTHPETGNRTYATARNALTKGALRPLLDEVSGIPGIADDVSVSSAFLIGAAGCHTALHYDISTVLLCPVLGRKRVWLVPPEEEVHPSPDAPYWALPFDLDDPSHAVREVVVEPGDALSIPAGWWHQVTSLEPSFLVTLAHLNLPLNRHAWLFPDG